MRKYKPISLRTLCKISALFPSIALPVFQRRKAVFEKSNFKTIRSYRAIGRHGIFLILKNTCDRQYTFVSACGIPCLLSPIALVYPAAMDTYRAEVDKSFHLLRVPTCGIPCLLSPITLVYPAAVNTFRAEGDRSFHLLRVPTCGMPLPAFFYHACLTCCYGYSVRKSAGLFIYCVSLPTSAKHVLFWVTAGDRLRML